MAERALQADASAVSPRPRSHLAERTQEVLALAKRWVNQSRREPLELVFSVAQPAIWLAFFGTAVGRAVDADVIGTSNYVGFMLGGIVTFTVIGNGVAGAMPLLWDKENGYLDKLMSMPIARSSVIMSRFLFQAALNSAQVLVIFAVSLVLGVDVAGGPVAVLVVLFTAALLSLAVTSAFAALAYAVPGHGTFFSITGFVTLPLLFLSNAFVPLDVLPGWMEVVARVNPLTYAISAVRILVLEGWTSGLWGELGVLAVFAGLCVALGAQQFRQQTDERVR